MVAWPCQGQVGGTSQEHGGGGSPAMFDCSRGALSCCHPSGPRLPRPAHGSQVCQNPFLAEGAGSILTLSPLPLSWRQHGGAGRGGASPGVSPTPLGRRQPCA